MDCNDIFSRRQLLLLGTRACLMASAGILVGCSSDADMPSPEAIRKEEEDQMRKSEEFALQERKANRRRGRR